MTIGRKDFAVKLSEQGFFVFPLKPGAKEPAHKGWQQEATRDRETIEGWWDARDYNIGITTDRFFDGKKEMALLVVDVDMKEGKNGEQEIVKLELGGHDFPETRVHTTPTGGRHLIYPIDRAVKQGANVLGVGLDIRSRGGYVVGPGSRVADGLYGGNGSDFRYAPAWIEERCFDGRSVGKDHSKVAVETDRRRSMDRAALYLEHDVPLVSEGGRNDTGYKVATHIKDLGLDEADCVDLMATAWKCNPPLDAAELKHVVKSAYKYGQLGQGSAAPEVDFKPVAFDEKFPAKSNPFSELNKTHAYVTAGGGDHILWETADEKGKQTLVHLNLGAFHRKHAATKVMSGNKEAPLTEEWMEWKGRRSYDGLVFMPECEAPDRFYNLWRGFAVEPLDRDPTPEEQAPFDMFIEHAKFNVCNGNDELFAWLMGYFAHMIQKPWEKPLVALVFKGQKGTGKNALIERVGYLLGHHFMVTDDDRYLLSNFNDHLESLLALALDEAAWAGDKKAEGRLKGLITGTRHNIEPKGEKRYEVDNLTRVFILGNERWLVPATHDERRFAVFDVGSGRRQDRKFFTDMRVGMEKGGYRVLLSYLKNYDLSGIDVNAAPQTSGLLEQKLSSFDPFHAWWNECLTESRLIGSDFGEGWPTEVSVERMRAALKTYVQDRGIRGRAPESRHFTKALLDATGGLHVRRTGGAVYQIPDLAQSRTVWEQFIGQRVEWPTEG
jgi:hypothetical protein